MGGSGRQRTPEPRYLSIARIIRPWGVRGEMKLDVLTGFPDKLDRIERVYLGPDAVPHRVAHFRWHSGELHLLLSDVRDIDAAEALRNQLVQIPLEAAVPLGPGEFYEHQIIGLQAWTSGGTHLGEIVDILYSPANDVYVVQGISPLPREILIPVIAGVVQKVDLKAGQLVVELPEGLL